MLWSLNPMDVEYSRLQRLWTLLSECKSSRANIYIYSQLTLHHMCSLSNNRFGVELINCQIVILVRVMRTYWTQQLQFHWVGSVGRRSAKSVVSDILPDQISHLLSILVRFLLFSWVISNPSLVKKSTRLEMILLYWITTAVNLAYVITREIGRCVCSGTSQTLLYYCSNLHQHGE